MRVRPAVADDVVPLAALHVRVWQAAYRGIFPDAFLDTLDVTRRERLWARLIGAGTPPLLVEEGGGILGFAATGPCRDAGAPPDLGELHAINVAPEVWGRGHAEALHTAALAELAGFPRAVLWVVEENRRARRFYEKHGWEAEETSRTETFGGAEIRERRYRR